MEGTVEVHRVGRSPVVVGQRRRQGARPVARGERDEGLGDEIPGVVDDDVDLAGQLERGAVETVDLAAIADVRLDGRRSPSGRTHETGGTGEFRAGTGREDDGGSGVGQGAGDGPAAPAPGSVTSAVRPLRPAPAASSRSCGVIILKRNYIECPSRSAHPLEAPRDEAACRRRAHRRRRTCPARPARTAQRVSCCGNETLILTVSALESLWSEQERQWAVRAASEGSYPEERYRRDVLTAHVALVAAIEAGDAEAAGHLDASHLQHSQRYALKDSENQVVRATSLRGGLRNFTL
jgi:hypothetical protein